MSTALVILNCLNLTLLISGVILLHSRKAKKKLPREIPLILSCLFGLFLFRHFSNVLEWSGITPILDQYEDHIRILEPIFFGILFFALFQQRLKNRIQESETKYRLIIQNQTDLIVKMDREGRFLFVSPSYCKMFGRTEAELLNTKFDDPVIDEDKPSTQLEWVKLLAEPYACYIRHRAVTNDGTKWFAWSCNAVLNDQNEIDSIAATGREITSQVKAHQEREDLLKALELKNRELQNIVYIASHDLQSPLVNIRGFSGELNRSLDELAASIRDDKDLADLNKYESLLSDINESIHFVTIGAEKMQVLIDGLLTISRIGTVEIKQVYVDMDSLLENIIKTLHYQIQQSKVALEIDNLVPCNADPIQLNHVFSNLIDNAVKYLDPNRPGKIHIYSNPKGEYNEYYISDNGIGIETKYQSKVFELFSRINPDSSIKGVGLGLTIVSRIVERFGGTISLESTFGEGSTFIISLPAAKKQ